MTVKRALRVLPEADLHDRERLREKAIHLIMLKMPNLMHDKGSDDELDQQWIEFTQNNAKLAFSICKLYFTMYMDGGRVVSW